uniref:RGAP1 protein n=1 Tax=Apteryx owenii TaxID=8824 RepID=A0A8B9PG89_APTOW
GRMMRQRCRHLLAQLERALRLLELNYIQIARCFEVTRQKCCRLEQDGRRAREQLARAEAERAALEVKLKHARNQVEVEMKKRHRAEAELEKQERKLQLIFEFLMQEPSGSATLTGEQRSVLSALVGQRLRGTLALGRRLSPAFQDVDMTVVKTLKRKAQERQCPRPSSCPRWRREPGAGAVPGVGSALPPVSRGLGWGGGGRCRVLRWVPGGWGGWCQDAGWAGLREGGPDPAPPRQIIRPEPCAACGSRIRFGKAACKCRQCQLLVHAKCRGQCPGPCAPRPRQHAWPREVRGDGVLADFAPPAPPLVPALVVQCVTEVETRGLTETGLYRVPGAEQLVREWKRRLLHGGGMLPGLGSVADIHVVCGVLKDFLRGLKEPLVTFGLHPAFLQAADIPDEAACSTALCHVVSKLPPANRDTLAFLMLHLLRVSRSPDCRMDVLNLSRVFGPTLVGHSSANPTPLTIMEDTPRQCKVVARLLSLPPDFWRHFVGMEQEKLVLLPAGTPAPGSECGKAQAHKRSASEGRLSLCCGC